MIKLQWSVIKSGKSGQTTLTLREPNQTEWLIGRGEGCDLVVPDAHVSATHAKIVFSDGEFYLIDLESSNGTSINGERIHPAKAYPLRLSDTVHLGVLTGITIEELHPLQQSQQLGQAQITWTTEPLKVQCCRIVEETPDTKSFVFAGERGERFDFMPGQFAMLELNINGQKVLRPYSISSAPLSYLIEFTIKRVSSNSPEMPPGVVSNWVNDQLQVGDILLLKGGPKGSFTFGVDIPPKLLLISAGSGITPMMSMLRWIFSTPWSMQTDVVFVHIARTPKDIAFRSELEWMSARMPNLRLLFSITRPEPGAAWSGLIGRLSEQILDLTVPDLNERSAFVCGPSAMMQHTKQLLADMGFPMEQYHEESFGDAPSSPPASKPTVAEVAENNNDAVTVNLDHEPSTNGKTAPPLNPPQHQASTSSVSEPAAPEKATASAAVTFTQTRQKVADAGSQTILEVAEGSGVTIEFACRSGRCGACKVKIDKGKVEYPNQPPDAAVLSAQEEHEGYALACIACPVGAIEVEA